MRFAGLAVLCAMTLVAPAMLLVWMPLLLGVPHVASDIRYLVMPLPRRQRVLAVAASLTLVGLKVASLGIGVNLMRAEVAVVAVWLLATLAIEPTCRRRAVGIALFASAIIVGMPIAFIAIAALAHNFLAVIAWLVVAKPTRRQALTLGGALVGFVVVAATLGPITSTLTGGDVSPWLSIDKASSLMFGGLPHGVARGLLLAFTFLQGVHYAIWLGWIPASQPARHSKLGVLAVGAATLLVLGGALRDPAWARMTYLGLATFHIYLEIVVLAARGSRRRVTP